jgi:hypothetical protein
MIKLALIMQLKNVGPKLAPQYGRNGPKMNPRGTPINSPPEGYAQTSPRVLLPRLSSAGFDRRGNFLWKTVPSCNRLEEFSKL